MFKTTSGDHGLKVSKFRAMGSHRGPWDPMGGPWDPMGGAHGIPAGAGTHGPMDPLALGDPLAHGPGAHGGPFEVPQ